MVGPAAFAGFLAGGAALTALDYSPSLALAYGARKFYKAANKASRQKAKMNELYGYTRGSQRSSGSKRGRSMSRGSSGSRSRSRSAGRHVNAGGVGHYQGRLPRVNAVKKPSKYEKSGITYEYERYGSQSLNDVCYLGATSFCHSELGKAVGVALIRKLMKRHYQYEYTNPGQKISPYAPDPNPGTYAVGPSAIYFYYEEITAADAEPTISVGWQYNLADKTLSDFGSDFYTNVLIDGDFGQDQSVATYYPIRRLHAYQFREYDANSLAGNYVERNTCLFPMSNQYVTCYSAVTLGVQNVTPADGGSLLTTHIDTNPIKGALYHFSDFLPRLQERNGVPGSVTSDLSYKLQIDANGDGIIKPDSSIIGNWVQIPDANMFKNCNGRLSVSLEPGAIRDYKLMFKFNGTLEKFMRGFAAFKNPLNKGGFGTCCLFAFEKRMPTGGAVVKINFHYESRIGCVFGKRLGVLMPKVASAGAEATAD